MTAARTFRVLINGTNFLMRLEGSQEKLGFYTARVVQAADETEAKKRAVELLWKLPKLSAAPNSPEDPPRIVAEQIVEVDLDALKVPPPGLAWYTEEREK